MKQKSGAVRKVLNRGIPELIEAMHSGHISKGTALEIASQSPEVQAIIVQREKKEIREAARQIRRAKKAEHEFAVLLKNHSHLPCHRYSCKIEREIHG